MTINVRAFGAIITRGEGDFVMLDHKTLLLVTLALVICACPPPSAAQITIAANGGRSSMVSDGVAWAWGYNVLGQLGDGTDAERLTPVQVSISGPVAGVGCGDYHTAILAADGTVWTCGYNAYGQLGDGGAASRSTPAQLSGLSQVTAIDAGGLHTVAASGDGTVWTWGYNAYGQLGDGSTATRRVPTQVPGLSAIKAVAAGYGHTVALARDGTVWTWGYNSYGQLGDGSVLAKSSPVHVSGLTDVVAICADSSNTMALKSDGTVWAWGYNATGQLGDGTTSNRLTPAPVPGLTQVVAVSAGYGFCAAVTSGGAVWTWGDNTRGQLGDGTTNRSLSPIQVPGISGVKSIALGSAHVLALKSSGAIWAWGDNRHGQLGDGTTTDRHSPIEVISGSTVPSGVVTIDGGADYTSTRQVVLTLSATDESGTVSEMCVSNDGVFDTEQWEPYSTARNWTLSDGDGTKTVYVKFRNSTGGQSAVATDTIILDTTPPAIASVQIAPAVAAAGDAVRVSVSASDAGGIASVTADGVALAQAGGTWTGTLTAHAALGEHLVTVVALDGAGNARTDSTARFRTARVVAAGGRCLQGSIAHAACESFLFRTWGRVTMVDSSSFDLDDGCGQPIRVVCPGCSGITTGDYVSACGILDASATPKTLTCDPAGIVRYD